MFFVKWNVQMNKTKLSITCIIAGCFMLFSTEGYAVTNDATLLASSNKIIMRNGLKYKKIASRGSRLFIIINGDLYVKVDKHTKKKSADPDEAIKEHQKNLLKRKPSFGIFRLAF
jgi:hypothetical protein